MKNTILTSRGQEAAKRKVSKFFLLISLSFLLTFNSCNNVFENTVSSDDEVQTASTQAAKKTPAEETPAADNSSKSKQPVTIEFGGSLKLKGAVPAEFVEKDETPQVQNNSRSANAQIPTGTDYEYYVTATSNTGDVREDVHPVSNSEITYTLQLEINKTWTFTAGLRKKASGTPNTDSYVAPKDLLIDNDTASGNSYSLALSDTTLQPAQQKTFMLRPLQTADGRGTINLTMSDPEDTGINSLVLYTSGANGLLQEWKPWAEGESPNLDISLTQIKTKNNMTIASGSYDITMIFYKGTFQAYISYQTINVFDNMETTIWASGNAPGTDSIISTNAETHTTSFRLTNNLVQKFASSTIYVGAPEGVTVEPDDSRVGSPYAPVRTLNRAFEIIKANTGGDGNTRDYRILVTTAKPTADKAAQPQKANLEIPASITSTEAKSIEIIGQGSGANLAVLEPAAGNSAGTILTVNTTVPVTLRNIKLAGGKGSGGKGGALSITQNSAKVTLGSGTVITGNEASDQGGGIYIQGSDASHKPKLIIKAGAEIKSNSIANGGTGGMAIYADCAEVEMTGGTISGNSKSGAQYGAVRLTGAAEFTMTGGSVANNDGGAFYVDSTYDSGTSTYTHSKLKIGGSASIPYGNSQTRNDVFVKHVGPDGGKYSPVCIKTQGLNLQSDSKIAITPDEWQRGLDILEADNGDNGDIENYKDYFLLTDADFNFSKSGSNVLFAKLKAPIYVGPNGVDTPTPAGTKEAPFRTLNRAVLCLAGGEPDVIKILGKVELEQSISSSFNTTLCSALTIKGEVDPNHPNDVPGIYVQESHNTSALTLDTAVPVTIENLKITGGQGTAESSSTYGGGIYLEQGTTLKLADGAVVTGNKAKFGGGVYVKKGASLFMYGTALIGASGDTQATGDEPDANWSNCGNYASSQGGGIYNAGSVYLGYKGINSGVLETADFTGGVRRNLSHSSAGGIDSYGTGNNDRSVLKIRAGKVSYNKAVNVAGGIRAFRSNVEILDGEISYNQGLSGGGLLVSSDADAKFSGGTIKENSATDGGNGGAVLVSTGNTTNFTMSGSASIPYGVTNESGNLVTAVRKNDVFLSHMITSNGYDQAIVRVGSSLSASGIVASITLDNWQRGLQFLGTGGSLGALPNGIENKFDFTDLGWEKKPYKKSNSNANDAVKIDSDIYVAGDSAVKCNNLNGASDPTDTDNTKGTWAHPFATIDAAAAFTNANYNTIIVDGTVKGSQEISNPGNSSITLQGYKAGASESAAALDGEKISGKTTLLVNSNNALSLTIKDLTIKGGNANGSGDAAKGGGIRIVSAGQAKPATVALADGVKITGNSAIYGGGVHVGQYSTLLMYGNSWVGDSTASIAGSGSCANSGTSGAGIYNAGGTVALGYTAWSGSSGTVASGSDALAGGVCRNYATNGGGIYNQTGTLAIAGGKLQGNRTITSGGAVYNSGNFTMIGGTIGGSYSDGNSAYNISGTYGGAVAQYGSFSISGSALITRGENDTSNSSNVKTGSNDVSLGSGKTITVASNTFNESTVAWITPYTYSRGTKILEWKSGVSFSNDQMTTIKGKFKLAQYDSDWDKENISESSVNYVAITCPIYVVGASGTGSSRPDTTWGWGLTSGANGTKSKPYASIADALGDSDLASVKEITIAGTLVGAQQAISSPAVDITLKGYKAAGVTTSDAKIQRFTTKQTSQQTDGSVLTVDADGKTVTITDLTLTYGYNSNGGGIYITKGTVKLDTGAKVIGNNAAYGGGVYISANGTLNMTGGLVGGSGNGEQNSAGTAGGAVYQGGTFNISGTAYIYPGSEKSNDVYLPADKYVSVISNWSGSQASNKMVLTPDTWKRGRQVINGTKAAACYTYFKTSDTEWSVGYDAGTTWTLNDDLKTRIGADIYVAGSSNRADGISAPSAITDGALGTKAKPYISISDAVNACWNSSLPFKINLSGTITGETQTIPAANSTAKTGLASSITIEGFTGNTSDVIDRNLSSAPASGGSALTISTATPVTIKKIKITKGYAASDGGGISVNGVKGASLTLGEGALITANKASSNGGGIYIGGTNAAGGTANLIMNSTATVSANNASLGGGIYLSYANLCMSGSALIGDTGVTSISAGGDNASNSATYGGGVYCVTGSNIYLGCNTSGQTSSGGVSYELGSGYGIRHNYASASGGGVDLHAGSMTIKSGSVSYNSTHYNWAGDRNGGGIWQISGSTITMSGGTIAKNQALLGGGVYAGGSFTMTGGTIGDSSSTINSPATSSTASRSNAASSGGGIYAPSGASVSISGGYINYNYANSDGGGIYWEGSTLSVTDGNISYNYGGDGGGIYFESGATLTKATFTKNNASSGGALYINSGKEVTVSGAAAFTGNTASSGGAIYNDGTFKLTGGATFTSNSASTSGGAVYNDETFIMSGSASISAGLGTGAKNNDIGLASGKTITTDGLTTTGTVGLVTPYSYYENETVITKGSNCSDTQFKVDTGKFILTPESNDYEWYIKNDGTISQGRGANVSNIEDVLKNIPDNEIIYDVHVCGPVSQDDFASIVSAMNQCTGHVLLDLTTATFTETINTNNLFKNCTKLEEIAFDVNTLPLSSTMFSGCENLDRLYIQGNVTSWPSGIFNNCGHLASIEFKNATSVTIPGTDYISYDGMVILLPTTLRTLKLGPLDSSVYQYMCGIRYNGTREDFKNSVSVSKTSANIETKAMINCYGESGGPRVYWKGYASGTAGGHFIEYTDWDTAY